MSWTVKADESSYEQPPTGPQAAVLTQIIDIGTHTDTSALYGTTRRHQVIFRWELAEMIESKGEPYTIQKFYTLSMNEKANMRKDLESWRGKAFDTGEAFEIDSVLGKPCLLNVTESETGKSKVSGISRLPKGMTPPTPRGELLLFRTDDPDWSVFEKLSEFTRKKIEDSEEYAGMKTHAEQMAAGGQAADPTPAGPGPDDDFDDDIPF